MKRTPFSELAARTLKIRHKKHSSDYELVDSNTGRVVARIVGTKLSPYPPLFDQHGNFFDDDA